MITFSELSLSSDRTTLTIACSGTASEQIAKVYLEYYKNYTSDGISDKAYKVAEYAAGSRPSTVSLTVANTAIEITGTTSFIDGLFYVYVQYYNANDAITLHTATAVVLDWERVYMEAMMTLKNLATDCGNCKDNQALIDFILRWEALKLAIDACDWDVVHCMWDRLFMMGTTDISDCGCNK